MPRQFPKVTLSEAEKKAQLLAEKAYASALKEEVNKDALSMFTVPEDCPIGLQQAKDHELLKELAEQQSEESVKREKYSKLAYHRFSRTTSQFLRSAENMRWDVEDEVLPGMTYACPCPAEDEDPYSMDNIPENLNYEVKMKDGIVYVYNSAEALRKEQPNDLPYPDLETFAIDLSHVLAMIADGPT
ncbi:hypothetical protein XENOCAPTIV_008987 [Xenoophorus captivus]|uniref:Uncharacterized protein n=1 Tax=Xenoophorus captivus TaxID=1517983 RepID=A0ABV0RGT6_9TELE